MRDESSEEGRIEKYVKRMGSVGSGGEVPCGRGISCTSEEGEEPELHLPTASRFSTSESPLFTPTIIKTNQSKL